ncbi:MAG: molybdate ABC transporter substrate-binding protein [Acidimicrobiia bacterium]|nr:molybdate ABC transporter substrate-binding protein [Acidimicrobiia bacterium]MYC57413.1 molybdate ABC transporter substrate-binding protein [Acidimicrobiia bacterium]MYG94610.1 molybdate ABC transporter substrate-binding protein [Acidimicrobiia bacterium]MYI30251.1 molybdate ABC transporter substrate-binding protein [Acidimicrobiia bacterium]
MQRQTLGALIGLLAWLLTGCGDGNKTIVAVYAAASLSDAFEDLAAEYEAQYETTDLDVKVKLNFAGSARLAAQISAGARADVFASANETTMSRIVADERTATPPVLFAHNQLALVVPMDNPGNITTLEDLSDDDLILAVCAPEVPCGALAQAVLADASIDIDADTEETSVRAVLTKVMLGEADAGLVYATDVTAGGNQVAAVPLDPQIRFNDYMITTISNRTIATDFVGFVLGLDGQRILQNHGFDTP